MHIPYAFSISTQCLGACPDYILGKWISDLGFQVFSGESVNIDGRVGELRFEIFGLRIILTFLKIWNSDLVNSSQN